MESQFQDIVSDLFLFEGALRREQKEIRASLQERDRTILSQKQTIESLMTSNTALVASLKKLKKRNKEKELSKNGERQFEGESGTAWRIQEEADAIIREMFGAARVESEISNGEFPDEETPTEYEHPLPEVDLRPTVPSHVCFYLTETKDEHAKTAMKLHRNKTSTTHFETKLEQVSRSDTPCSASTDRVNLKSETQAAKLEDLEGILENREILRSQETERRTKVKAACPGSSSYLGSITEERLDSDEKWRCPVNKNYPTIEKDVESVHTSNLRLESESDYDVLVFSQTSSSGEEGWTRGQTQPGDQEIYQNLPRLAQSCSNSSDVRTNREWRLHSNPELFSVVRTETRKSTAMPIETECLLRRSSVFTQRSVSFDAVTDKVPEMKQRKRSM